MKRREFLKIAAGALVWPCSHLFLPSARAAVNPSQRILVLIELKGGNDGLNTLVPYSDERYYQMRSGLAVKRDKVLPLSENLGLNPSLEALMAAWRQKELAIVAGVGYPQPNRSHFRSIEIWETGSSSNQYLQNGWLARLIASNAAIPAIKVSHGGFDTHANQRNLHDRLLQQLADAMIAFRHAMQQVGRWEQVLVVTYSEFGRRPAENGSRGTDHGTAAPHLVMGGKVKGGLYGRQPSLGDLENGDLKYSVDYRSLYTTIGRRWWGLKAEFLEGGPYPVVDFI